MTKLLERAFAAAARLPEEEQDAIAARVLVEIEDEGEWDRLFEATSEEQWDRLAAMARRGAAEGGASLDELTDAPPD